MADIIGQDQYTDRIRQMETTDLAIPDSWNPIHQALINSIVHLKNNKLEKAGDTIDVMLANALLWTLKRSGVNKIRYGMAANSSDFVIEAYIGSSWVEVIRIQVADGATKISKGPLYIIDANRRIKQIGSIGTGVAFENILGELVLTGKTYIYNAVNAVYDGTNWNRIDTSKPASITYLDSTDGKLYIKTAPAGNNPIAWSGPYEIYNSNNLPAASVSGIYTNTSLSLTAQTSQTLTIPLGSNRSKALLFMKRASSNAFLAIVDCGTVQADTKVVVIDSTAILRMTTPAHPLMATGCTNPLTNINLGTGNLYLQHVWINGSNLYLTVACGNNDGVADFTLNYTAW